MKIKLFTAQTDKAAIERGLKSIDTLLTQYENGFDLVDLTLLPLRTINKHLELQGSEFKAHPTKLGHTRISKGLGAAFKLPLIYATGLAI